MYYILIICIIVGVLDAHEKISLAKLGVGSVKSYKNLARFLLNE
jgi:hypothetical protein